jgi:putative methylase
MKRAALVRRLEAIPPFERPRADREQVATPAEAAAELLERARDRGDLVGRTVADLGSGTGRLAIGAALLGAARVIGREEDPAAVGRAREEAARAGVEVIWEVGDVTDLEEPVDTVIMNPPFGAQRRGADRPFWETAFRTARRAIYAFSLADSRTFIVRSCVERGVPIAETRPIRWSLPATFRHHRKPRVELAVDLWVLGAAPNR